MNRCGSFASLLSLTKSRMNSTSNNKRFDFGFYLNRKTLHRRKYFSSSTEFADADKFRFLRKRKSRKNDFARTYGIILGSLAVLILAAIGIIHLTSALTVEVNKLVPPDPEVPLPKSPSILRRFKRAAVCSDGAPCSEIGRDILEKNGSAVDAAVATLFCNGVVNFHSMGLGGGFMMTIYDRKTQKSYSLNARETAPAAATEDMYRSDSNKTKKGSLAAGVPGELAGYWAAHQKFGRLPWSEVVKPTLKICQQGYNMTEHQYNSLNFRPEVIHEDEIFKSLFVNKSTGKFHPPGTRIVQSEICRTLKIIAEKGGDVLYNGSLAKVFVNDIEKMGGIITLEDMEKYRVQWGEPVVMPLRDGITLHSAPPPGSGALLSLILNILDNYEFTYKSVQNEESLILTYHRIVEAFKFAFAKRTEFGDPLFVNSSALIQNSVDRTVGALYKAMINDNKTFEDPKHYGASFYSREDSGTAHVSVLSPEGDAVSATSTVNLYFGAGVTSKSTGIVINSQMDDFSFKYFTNYFDLPHSPANKLEPGKRPFSSMCPSILVDSNGDVRLVIGASGGTKIITAVAYVIIRHLWFGDDIKAAIDASRIHHQLIPMSLNYEFGILHQTVNGLQKLGHEVERIRKRSSVVCAIAQLNQTIFANADFRKGGDVHGF